ACGRTPARTQPRPQTTASPAPAHPPSTTTVTPAARHQQKCTPAEEKEAACLNGECYALDFKDGDGGNRSAFCQCPELYEGDRCEQLSDDFFGTSKFWALLLFLIIHCTLSDPPHRHADSRRLIFLIAIAISHGKRRKRENMSRLSGEQETQMNGNAAQPLMKET
ncbi:hypothetical protein BaRGS_00010148, partial [Batillaria attramentaria]